MIRGLIKRYFSKIQSRREPIYAEDLIWQKQVYPFYIIAQNNFNYCMKNGLLTRQEILNFKFKLNSCIKNKKKYQGIKFKNDAHEIYSKLKDTSISKKQMLELNEYFQPTLKLANQANQTEIYRKVKHLAIIK